MPVLKLLHDIGQGKFERQGLDGTSHDITNGDRPYRRMFGHHRCESRSPACQAQSSTCPAPLATREAKSGSRDVIRREAQMLKNFLARRLDGVEAIARPLRSSRLLRFLVVRSVDQSRSADTKRNGTVNGRTVLRKSSLQLLSGIRRAITRSVPSGICSRGIEIESRLKKSG